MSSSDAASSSPSELTAAPSTSPTAAASSLLNQILSLEEIDTNMYRGYSPEEPRWGRVYGGQTVAQALVASCRTVDPKFVVHSLHAYFLRAGNDELPILYYVERLRTGRSFAQRRVTALQKGQAIFAMMVSFMIAEQGREHQDPMPPVPPPEHVQSLKDHYRDLLAQPDLPQRLRKGLERSVAMPFPVELRRCEPATLQKRLQPGPAVQRTWMRVVGQLGDSPMLHQCAIAYMADWTLLETALLPHGLHGMIKADDGSTVQMASIDHAMWFHHSFRADEWLLYDMESPAASGSRGLARGRFFTRDGRLIVSTAQEGLMRVHQGPPPPIRTVGSGKNAHNTTTAAAAQYAVPARTTKPTATGELDSSAIVKEHIRANL